MKRSVLALCACAALAACATGSGAPEGSIQPQAGPQPAFHPEDFAWSAKRGTSAISGETAFSQGGQRFSCAGQAVVLTPDAPYSRNRIVGLYGSAERAALPVNEVRSRQAARPSVDYSAFARKTTCDAQDRFSFQGLPAGAWFVIVVAQPPGGAGEPMALMRRVETHAGAVRVVTVD